ncbi:hypothetical protein NIM87_03835 [Devosia sp. XJ19-1]|uniref:Methyltransferase type 11 domain-containing protein n=1 Tax=Devosia ureilytica TaxID=2952754 RepID=A0A9Q4AKX3_9HYPH|nr:hypothetical protein [Devosia ureilytica]MCP8882617.1 hypothetical protein [Devosia ureilytica]MCP8885496.1 hypothetical protein [Devosia ureilytica]
MERVHQVPRQWSNRELAKYASIFGGDVVNVSGWKDSDKQGRTYRSYFGAATTYTITNFDADKRGFQGADGELFLDLEQPLSDDLKARFDVVFNHTTLEHVYDFRTAFSNLCAMSKDVVIVVVPFVQQMHADYGDFWRFTPQALTRMFKDEGLEVGYLSFNNDFRASVYVLCIATKNPDQWQGKLPFKVDYADPKFAHLKEPFAGSNAIHSNWKTALKGWWISTFGGKM